MIAEIDKERVCNAVEKAYHEFYDPGDSRDDAIVFTTRILTNLFKEAGYEVPMNKENIKDKFDPKLIKCPHCGLYFTKNLFFLKHLKECKEKAKENGE